MKLNSLYQMHYRLIYATLWGFGISFMTYIPWLCWLNIIAMLVFIGLLKFNHKSVNNYAKRWGKFTLFYLAIFAMLSWHITVYGVQFYDVGFALAKIIVLRMNLLLFSLWILLFNVNELSLLQGILQLPIPLKLKRLFILTIRYIVVLSELNHAMDRAMKARGFQASCNTRTLSVFSQKIALLLIHALDKIEKSQIALKARGFKL